MEQPLVMEVAASPVQAKKIDGEIHLEKSLESTSTDSGSLTQRAAMIRDELLGNDSIDQDTVHASSSSSNSSENEGGNRNHDRDEGRDSEDELEERLSKSSIAHSLRHIALAFDEKSRELESLRKIQQTHDAELDALRSELEAKETERQNVVVQLDHATSSLASLQREVEALRIDIEHKNDLLCFSDRISSRLFDMIHNIRDQVEAAEALSPAIRSLSFTPSSSSPSDATSSSPSDESEMTTPTDVTPAPLEELIKQIEAKYAD